MKMKNEFDVLVIGAGAAGMMCAYEAANNVLSVALADPNNQHGRKLRMTGKGRCNITNFCDAKTFLTNVCSNSKFLYSSISAFSPEAAYEFFESKGLKLKIERGRRVFPVSDNANDVADLLAKLCKESDVCFIKTKVRHIDKRDNIFNADCGDFYIKSKSVCICTGGLSYPKTGSNGDGYRFANHFGHTIVDPVASLVPLESDDSFCGELQGFSLRNVTFTLFENGKKIYSELGEMLFTHFGISGPLVLTASCYMKNKDSRYCAELDLKPGLDEKKLDARILRDFSENQNRDFKNVLGALAGKSMIPVLIRKSGIAPETQVNSITREQRMKLVQLFKHFPISISAKRPVDEAIITSGGVSTAEINPRTMESKLCKGLYFAGEVIDVDAYTGGYNLQIAWSTGYLAGKNILRENND